MLGGAELGLEVPVARRAELDPLPLPVDDQPGRDRLDPARRELRHDLLPQHRGDLVAVEPVEDAPGLVGVDLAVVELGRVGDGAGDRLRGDLVEDHPAGGDLGLELLEQVPGDGLALAVLVCRQVELVGVLEQRLELGDLLLLVGRDDVEGLEVVVDVDAEAGPRLRAELLRDLRRLVRHVADVADARLDHVAACRGSRRWSWPWRGTRRSRAWCHDRSRRRRSSRCRSPRCSRCSRPPLSSRRPCSLLARSFQPHIKSAMARRPAVAGLPPRSDATPAASTIRGAATKCPSLPLSLQPG